MSDDDYEPMDHIDWDLIDKDHTIEWLVHLCEVFNRGKVANQWTNWPEDFFWELPLSTITEEHGQMWLHVAALICQNPGITVSYTPNTVPGRFGPETVFSNDISVTGRFGSEFKIKMMPDLSDWNEIEHPQGVDCVPEELHHLLKEPRTVVINGERVLSNENYVPETVYLCWECPRGIPTPVGLYSLLLAMLDETKVWEYLLDYIATECRGCHDTGFHHREDYLRQPGSAPGSLVGWDQFRLPYPSVKEDEDTKNYYLCYWCGPDAPDHH